MYFPFMATLLTLMFAMYTAKVDEFRGQLNTLSVSSEVGAFVVDVANGFTRKIIDYENEVGLNFVGPNVGDFIELTDAEVYNALKSNGSMVATEPAMTACVRGGITVGTAVRSYLPCDTSNMVPGGTNGKAYARFERINLTSVPDTYTTGYSQIEGVIYIGSRGETEPFAFHEGDPNPRMADKIAEWASIKGTMINTTNVLTAPVVDITSTADGAIKITFTMVRNNQLTLRSDGSVPASGDINFAQNAVRDADAISFSTLNGGSVVDVGSLTATATSSSNHTLTLDARNNLVLTAANTATINATTTNISTDLNVGDDLDVNDNIRSRTLFVEDSAQITNTLQVNTVNGQTVNADTGNFNVINATTVNADGVSLSYQIKRRGVVNSGSGVADISCPAGQSQAMLANIVDLAPYGRPITGWSVIPSRVGSNTVLTVRLALDNGAVVDAPTTSYLSYEQWCQ